MKMCNKIQKYLDSYLTNELSEKQKRFVEEHLETCSECKSQLEELRADKEFFREAFKGIKAKYNPEFVKELPSEEQEEAKLGLLVRILSPKNFYRFVTALLIIVALVIYYNYTSYNMIRLTLVNGYVEYTYDSKNWLQAKEGDTLKSGFQISTDKVSICIMRFFDGSKIILNRNSFLEVNKVSYYCSNRKNVRINLQNGEANFDVAKGGVFQVQSEDWKINVVGTNFNVSFLNDLLKVTLVEGWIRLDDGASLGLIPNRQFQYNLFRRTHEIKQLTLEEIQNEIKWVKEINSYKTLKEMGDYYYSVGDAEKAASCYIKSLEINPDYRKTAIDLSNMVLKSPSKDIEIKYILDILEKNPDSEYRYVLGRIYLTEEMYDDLIKLLPIENINKYPVWVSSDLAKSYYHYGDDEEAERIYKKILPKARQRYLLHRLSQELPMLEKFTDKESRAIYLEILKGLTDIFIERKDVQQTQIYGLNAVIIMDSTDKEYQYLFDIVAHNYGKQGKLDYVRNIWNYYLKLFPEGEYKNRAEIMVE